MEKTIAKFKPDMVIEFHAPSLEEYESGSHKRIYDFLIKYYGKIKFLASSYFPQSREIEDISYGELMRQTTQYDSRNVYVTNTIMS